MMVLAVGWLAFSAVDAFTTEKAKQLATPSATPTLPDPQPSRATTPIAPAPTPWASTHDASSISHEIKTGPVSAVDSSTVAVGTVDSRVPTTVRQQIKTGPVRAESSSKVNVGTVRTP